ncbi:MAG TPA: TonB-dependent receptor [Opitutaceae bacterium]|nr:TonB-dependent receptor [Opitutaceae bacterium]
MNNPRRSGPRTARAASTRGVRRLSALPSVVLIGALAAVAAPSTLSAQQPAPAAATQGTGTVAGRVADAGTEKYLEGAEIIVVGTSLKASANRDGSFSFSGVPAGEQTLIVNYLGMEEKKVAVTVASGETARVDVKLNPEVIRLEDFTVTGTREGMAQAVVLQKVSVQTKLVAAADQFGPISEGNVGEYLKFLPGVSIDYNVNDARGVSLRGLSTAFTIVAVDGTPMAGASSVDLTRRFEFEQIAMNNVETTELFKTVTPDISASATGGFVNFVTKSAFDNDDVQRVSYDLSFGGPGSNYKLFSKTGGVWGHKKETTVRPNLEVNVARKITDKVGINLNYRYSDKYDDAPRTIENWTLSGTAATLTQYDVADEQKLTHRESLAAKVDVRFTENTKIFFAGSWNNYDLLFTQRYIRFSLGTNPTITDGVVTSGTSGTRNVQNAILQRRKYGDTWHFNSTFEHKFGDDSVLRITPYWSLADGKYGDTDFGYISGNATYTYSASNAVFNTVKLAGIYDLTSAPAVFLSKGTTTTSPDFLRDLGNYSYVNSGTALQSRPWRARDIKDGINGNYVRELLDGSVPVKLDVGFAYDDVYRSIYKPDFRGSTRGTTTLTGDALRALADGYYNDDVAFGYGSLQAIDPYALWTANEARGLEFNNFDQYRFEENNVAGYARFDVNATPDLLLVGGIRWERRKLDAFTNRLSGSRVNAGETHLKYDNWYPSISLKYSPRKWLVIRGGASRTVGHPDYTDLVTSVQQETATGGDGSITMADPDLKPYYAMNFDLGADYYIGSTGVVGVSLFHKKLENFISSRSMTSDELTAAAALLGVDRADFNTGAITVNGASATYQGFELSYAQNFTFLPKPFKGLNIQANYSYTDVSSSDPDTEYSALRAVSPQTFNLIVGYRLGRFNATVTNNWVDEALYGGFVNTSYFSGTGDNRLLRMKDEKWTTDAKIEFSLNKYLSIYVLARNIFNTGRDEFFQGYTKEKESIRLPMRYGEFGEPYYTFGIRGTF